MPHLKVFFEIWIFVPTNNLLDKNNSSQLCSMINELNRRFSKFTLNVQNKSERGKHCSAADGVLPSNFSYHIFLENYFTSFRLLIHLGVNNFEATGVLNKNTLRKCIITWDKQSQKKECGCFDQLPLSQKMRCKFGSGLLERPHCVMHSFSKSSKPKRFVLSLNKIERNYIQEKHQQQK